MLYRDIKLNNGSLQDRMGATPISNTAVFSQKEKGLALETRNDKYSNFDRQLLPNGSFSLVVWARIRDAATSSVDRIPVLGKGVDGTEGSISIWFPAALKAMMWMGPTYYRYFDFTYDKNWHCFIFTITGTDINTAQMFVDANVAAVAATVNGGNSESRSTFTYLGGSNTANGGLHISRLKVYDTVLTQQEINAEYAEFLAAQPINKPKRGFIQNKPTNLSQYVGSGAGQGLLAAYNMVKNGNTLVDISGNGNNLTLAAGNTYATKEGVGFPNSGYYTKTGFVGLNTGLNANAYTMSVRFKLKELGREQQLVNLPTIPQRYINPANKLNMAGASGVLTGNTTLIKNVWYTASFLVKNIGAEIYLNGVSDGSNTTYTENITALTLWLGQFNGLGNYILNGEIADLRIHNRVLTPQECRDYHNSFVLPALVEDFSDAGADGITKTDAPAREWERVSGTWKVGQITTADPVLPTITSGTKYLECVTAGIVAIPSISAYGSWEFDLYKGSGTTVLNIGFIGQDKANYPTQYGGYRFIFESAEDIYLDKINGASASTLMKSATSYITFSTWYRCKITRTTAGVYTVLIKGGAFTPTAGYDGWTLVSASGGSGSNPVTDNTYTTSNYFTVDLDAGDRIANIIIKDGIKG